MVVCPFVLFLLAIVLSVLLRYAESDNPFGIFKLFLHFLYTNSVTYGVDIPGPGLGQAYNMGRVKLVMFLRICNLHTSCISKHQISHNVML
jgi:hypothetical protein